MGFGAPIYQSSYALTCGVLVGTEGAVKIRWSPNGGIMRKNRFSYCFIVGHGFQNYFDEAEIRFLLYCGICRCWCMAAKNVSCGYRANKVWCGGSKRVTPSLLWSLEVLCSRISIMKACMWGGDPSIRCVIANGTRRQDSELV